MRSGEEKRKLQTQFREDGFVFIPRFLSEKEISKVHGELEKLIREKVPEMPPEHVFYEDKNDHSTLKQIQTLYSYSPFFHKMMFNSKFEQLAELLMDDNVVGRNMQYFNKPPRIGQPTPPHQDGYYFKLEPNEAVTIWLALENVDEENGCVRYIKGSHLKGMRPHAKTKTLGFSQGISDYGQVDRENETWFATKTGDLLAHHAFTIHRADSNQSQNRTRKALGFIYYAQKAKEDKIAKKEYQAKLTEEIKTGKMDT